MAAVAAVVVVVGGGGVAEATATGALDVEAADVDEAAIEAAPPTGRALWLGAVTAGRTIVVTVGTGGRSSAEAVGREVDSAIADADAVEPTMTLGLEDGSCFCNAWIPTTARPIDRPSASPTTVNTTG